MSIIRFIGDVHGRFGQYRRILKDSPHPTIQVGDMGIGFRRWPHGEAEQNPPYDVMAGGGHRFIRGNHDNPGVCSRHTQHIPDGTIEGNVMFVGGALSIDKEYRHEGFSWWADEELSPDGLEEMANKYRRYAPNIMITHDCPESIAAMVVPGGSIKLDPRFASRTRVAFERMLAIHKPRLWIFGHWHVRFDHIHQGTQFVCLPELATMDVDVDEFV